MHWIHELKRFKIQRIFAISLSPPISYEQTNETFLFREFYLYFVPGVPCARRTRINSKTILSILSYALAIRILFFFFIHNL